MKSLFITGVGCLVLFIACMWFMVTTFERAEGRYKATLGESVTISGEQKQVVDFSILQSNLTLSDGSKISYDYFERLNDPNK